MKTTILFLSLLMSNSVELDLHEMRNGVYIAQVEMGGYVIREKVVMNK